MRALIPDHSKGNVTNLPRYVNHHDLMPHFQLFKQSSFYSFYFLYNPFCLHRTKVILYYSSSILKFPKETWWQWLVLLAQERWVVHNSPHMVSDFFSALKVHFQLRWLKFCNSFKHITIFVLNSHNFDQYAAMNALLFVDLRIILQLLDHIYENLWGTHPQKQKTKKNLCVPPPPPPRVQAE